MIQTPALRLVDQALVDLAEGRERRLMVYAPPQEGKLVAHDEPVPTPRGWRRHGDLSPGDEVYHSSGRRLCVTGVSDDGYASLTVTTTDGGSVTVHPRHEWTVLDHQTKRWRTVETAELANRALKVGGQHSLLLPPRGRLDGALGKTSSEQVAVDSIETTEPRPGRCISVDSADGLYLVGRHTVPTHNSERCSRFYPLWMMAHDQSLRVAIVSFDSDTARRWGWQLRLDIETFNGENHEVDLGLRLYERPAAGFWRLRDQFGSCFTTGISGNLTGKPVDVLILDDPIKDLEQANSVTYRERAWRFWQAVAIPRMGNNTKVLLVQTRWHEDDLAGRILQAEGDKAKGGKWRVISIPAQCEDERTDLLGRREGEYMISARGRTAKDWEERRKDVGEYVWAALFQQRPAPAEGGIYKRLWWRYWQRAGEGMIHLGSRIARLDDCWRFATVDLAASERTSADYTVIAAWARTLAGDLVLLDRVRARIGEAKHFEHARGLVERWNLDTLFVEKSQHGFSLVREATQHGVPITPLTAETDKVTRALPASAWCSGGRVWLPANAWWLDEFRDEAAAFPSGSHDDQCDVLAYAVRAAITEWVPLVNRTQQATARPEPEPDPFGGQQVDDWDRREF